MSAANGTKGLRGRILAAEVKRTMFKVAGWDQEVEMRPMSVAQKTSLAIDDEEKPSNEEATMILPKAVMFTVHDPESGEPVFTEDDLSWLVDQPANVIEDIAEQAFKISGVGGEAFEEAKKGS